jgi:hypothetical protein
VIVSLAITLFKREYLVNWLIVLLVMFFISALMLPAVGAKGGSTTKTSSLTVEKTVMVGSYEISILKALKVADLNSWLAENGFAAMPQSADTIVDEYLSKKWGFAAIKLARDEAGANAPHPIKMKFPSKDAVYPLKLTSLVGGSPQFEIFVIADQKAACGALPVDFCDRFAMSNTYPHDDYDAERKYTVTKEANAIFTGEDSDLQIAHLAIQALMWDKCVVTKFAGAIDSTKMTSDLNFSWVPFEPYRQRLFTTRGARETVLIWFVGAMGVWVFVSMIIFRKRIRTPGGPIRFFGVAIVPAVAILALAAAVGYARMPKLADSEVNVSPYSFSIPSQLYYEIRDLVQERPEVLEGTEQEAVEAILGLGTKEKPKLDRTTGGQLRQEDSPGNFTVRREDDSIVIRVYGYDGSVSAIRRASPGSRQ